MEIDREEAKQSVKFIIGNIGTTSKFLDRKKLKEALKSINKASILGFNSKAIKSLCETVIFGNQYDVLTRKNLLYSMVPSINSFPYEVIPLALSSATAVPVSSSWQTSVLRWLCGLLDYEIIIASHPMLHMCYPVLVILLTNSHCCGLACKILCKITRRGDVTKHRIQILLRLKSNPGFCETVPHLIRIYKIYRPDMISCTVGSAVPLPRISGRLQEILLATQLRLQEDSSQITEDEKGFWPDHKLTKKKKNNFQMPSALPLPDVILYSTKIEEQKSYRINVMQYTSLKELANTVSRWRSWQWPANPSSMLWKPAAIALFRPQDKNLKIHITNWLEIALRSEIVEGSCKNPNRQSQLLSVVIALAENLDTSIPVVYHFIIEFLVKWDRYTHMEKVLQLLPFVPFVSPIFFFQAIFDVVSFLMVENKSISLWCRLTLAMGELAKNWALEEVQGGKTRSKGGWAFEISDSSPIEGIYFLCQQMEQIFVLAMVKFKYHPAILNAILGFYDRVNLYCEHLELPLFIVPPAVFVFAVSGMGGPFVQHRMATILSTFRGHVTRVKAFAGAANLEFIRSLTLASIPTINICVRIFLDAVIGARGFNSTWMADLSNLFNEEVLKDVKRIPNISAYGYVSHNLTYCCLSEPDDLGSSDGSRSEKGDEKLYNVLDKLSNEGLAGIKNCGSSYNAFEE